MSYLSKYILATRYLRDNEKDFDDIAKRVSNYIGNNDNERRIFYELMINKKFLPGGRTLACSGTNQRLIPNCVVLPVEDNLEGIFNSLKRAAILQKAGCGLGFNFSKLRPAGYNCRSSPDKASGPISFMNLYSHAFKIVQQYNRSGANIGILSIEHPDIVSFIHMKDDLKVMNNFNISVLITKRFMDQYRNNPNTLWYAKWDDNYVKPRLISYDKDILVTDISDLDITAKEMFDELVDASWSTGEPGVLFEENMNVNNYLKDYLGPINSVNPCVVAGTRLYTDHGNIIIDEHVGEIHNVWNGVKFTPAMIKITGHNQTVYKVMVSNGRYFTCTGTHMMPVYITNFPFMEFRKVIDCKSGDELWDPDFSNIETNMKNYEDRIKWLKSLIYDYDDINGIQIKADHEFLHELQLELITLGCKSIVKDDTLFIPPYEAKEIGLLAYGDEDAVRPVTHLYITSIEELPDKADEVYCVTTLDNSHMATFDGIVSHNCGEISLYPNECCNLGSMNLEEYCSINPVYGSKSIKDVVQYIHVDELKKDVSTAILFMNNVIDKLDIPDDELRSFVLIMRRLGLGIMGLSDMLIKLKIPYNSELGREVVQYVLKAINEESHRTSERLSKKYGTVLDRLGIRGKNNLANCACTCIAPTGSTSMIHNVSSGIEPYFALAYRRSLNGKLQDEVIMNKHLEKYLKDNGLYNEDVIDTIITKGIEYVSLIPNEVKEVFITAQSMKPEDHVMMQAMAQKYIDNSISKTCNFPHSATHEDVAKIYIMAYDNGCKGITVYRDGCRDSQVFSCKNGSCDQ